MEQLTSEWIDCGSYQNKYCEYGQIALTSRPSYCDRGRFVVNPLTVGPVNKLLNLISGNYYFNEEFAKQEIDSWLKLASSAIADGSIYALDIAKAFKSQQLAWSHAGKNCVTRVYKFQLLPLNVNLSKAELQPNVGDELKLFIDWADMWDRKIYFNSEIAYSEVSAWLRCRNQI